MWAGSEKAIKVIVFPFRLSFSVRIHLEVFLNLHSYCLWLNHYASCDENARLC